jgi:hypothetical protein
MMGCLSLEAFEKNIDLMRNISHLSRVITITIKRRLQDGKEKLGCLRFSSPRFDIELGLGEG